MYRVLVKIEKVFIRIREKVELEVLFKKGKHFFIHSKGHHIINGVAELIENSEFCLAKDSPSFKIQTFLLFGSLKKSAGSINLLITDFTINTSHRCKISLQKSPDSNSFIEINFMYMQTNLTLNNLDFFSVCQIQQEAKQQKILQFNAKKKELTYQRERLNENLERLKVANKCLQINRQNVQKQIDSKENGYIQKRMQYEKESLYYKDNARKQMEQYQRYVSMIQEYRQTQRIDNQVYNKQKDNQMVD